MVEERILPWLIDSATRSMSGRWVLISCQSMISENSSPMCPTVKALCGRYSVRSFQLQAADGRLAVFNRHRRVIGKGDIKRVDGIAQPGF
jgi:hypothetical protein